MRPAPLALATLTGAAAALLVGGPAGLLAGPVVARVTWRRALRVEPARVRRDRARAVADMPYAVDLLAAVLRAGQPVDAAVPLVAGAVGGPVGASLDRVGRSLALGVVPEAAWAQLSGLPGGDRLAAAVHRSAESGAALARSLDRLADDLRAHRAAAVESAARRAGVLIVVPLGLCFLPAFIVAGIVPVIVAVFGDVLQP